MILAILLSNEEGKLVENLSVSMNEWKGSWMRRLQVATRTDILYLFGQESVFLSGKSQGIWKVMVAVTMGERALYPTTNILQLVDTITYTNLEIGVVF